MRRLLFLFLFLIPIYVFAQYPNAPRKIVLGYQTTADGLIYRDSGPPSFTPSSVNDVRAYIDTDNGDLYVYQGSWIQIASLSMVSDTATAIRALIGTSTETPATAKIYCPSHGLDTTSYVGKVIALQATCTLADASSSSTFQTRYVVDTPHPDTLTIQVSGIVSRPSHGLTPGTQYYLQDSPSDGDHGTSPGTVESKTFVVFDDDNIHLIDPAATSTNFEIPVVNIPAAAFSVYGTDAKSPNDTAVQNIAEIYAAAEIIANGSYLIAYNASISDNEIYRANADGSSTPFHVWQWNGSKVTRLSSRPVAIHTQDTLYGSSGLLPLDTIVPADSIPTTGEVVNWLEDNYNNNGLRLPNGSIVYYEGSGSTAEPQAMWIIMDDLSSTASNNFSRIVKKIVSGTSSGGGGGTPADNDGAVQYNNSGAFGGDDTNFFWDDTNNRLGIGTNTPSAEVHVEGDFNLSEQHHLYDYVSNISGTGYVIINTGMKFNGTGAVVNMEVSWNPVTSTPNNNFPGRLNFSTLMNNDSTVQRSAVSIEGKWLRGYDFQVARDASYNLIFIMGESTDTGGSGMRLYFNSIQTHVPTPVDYADASLTISSSLAAYTILESTSATESNGISAIPGVQLGLSDTEVRAMTLYNTNTTNNYSTSLLLLTGASPNGDLTSNTLGAKLSSENTGSGLDLVFSPSTSPLIVASEAMRLSSSQLTVLVDAQIDGDILAADGSAANPSISNTGDEDTGGYYPGADQYALSTGGVQRFAINDTGLVTIVNSGELEVQGPSGTGSTELLRLYRAGGWGGGVISAYRSGLDHGLIFGGYGASPTKSDVFTMDFYNGKIGIHETDPSASLQINATEGTGDLRIAYDASNYVTFTTNSSGDAIIDPTSDYMQFGGQINVLGPAGATDDVLFSTTKSGGYGQTYFRQYYDSFSEQGLRLSYNTTGDYDFTFQTTTSTRLGIGLQSPAEALDVSGNIQSSGVLLVSNGSASAPSISNTGDKNTGLYFGSADQMDFATNGSQRMFISSTGLIQANNTITVTNGTNTNELEDDRIIVTNGTSGDFVIITPEAMSVDNSTDNVDPSESQISGSYIYVKQREPTGTSGAVLGAFNTGDTDPVLKLGKGSQGANFYNTDVIGIDTVLGVIEFFGQDQSGNMQLSGDSRQGVGASIQAVTTETFSTSAHGAKLEFYTVDNTTTTQDLRMTIDEDGTFSYTPTPGNEQMNITPLWVQMDSVYVLFGTSVFVRDGDPTGDTYTTSQQSSNQFIIEERDNDIGQIIMRDIDNNAASQPSESGIVSFDKIQLDGSDNIADLPDSTRVGQIRFEADYALTSSDTSISLLDIIVTGVDHDGDNSDPAAYGDLLIVSDNESTNVFKLDGQTGDATIFGAIWLNEAETLGILNGSGSPEGVETASVGSLYLRTDGEEGTTVYEKQSGTGNTGWVSSMAYQSKGLMKINGGGTVTVAGVAEKMDNDTPGTTATEGSSTNFTISNGRMTYTGTDTLEFFVLMTVSSSTSNASESTYIIRKNGTTTASSKFRDHGTSGDTGSISVQGVVELATNDYIEPYISTVASETFNLDQVAISLVPW